MHDCEWEQASNYLFPAWKTILDTLDCPKHPVEVV